MIRIRSLRPMTPPSRTERVLTDMGNKVRGTIAVLAGCIAAAAGATPAVASAEAPVRVPLEGVENALHMEAPEISTAVPVPIPGTPEGPEFSADHVLPQKTVPRLPVSSGLPATEVDVPVPQLLPAGDSSHLGVRTAASDVRTATLGASVNPPLSGPQAERLGLPKMSTPQLAVGAPDVQAQPGADLAFG